MSMSFGLWEAAEVPGDNPRPHREKMQTLQREDPAGRWPREGHVVCFIGTDLTQWNREPTLASLITHNELQQVTKKKMSNYFEHPGRGHTSLHTEPQYDLMKNIPHGQLWVHHKKLSHSTTGHHWDLRIPSPVLKLCHSGPNHLLCESNIKWNPHLLYWLQTALWLFLWLKWHWSAWWQTQWNRHCSNPAMRKPNINYRWFWKCKQMLRKYIQKHSKATFNVI